VAAARAVHDRLRASAANGAAILVYSSDLDEVLELADRVVVMIGGRVKEVDGQRSTVDGQEATGPRREEVGRLMLGAE
jgi:ABC-type uncharacterized transport system ATPase subunit